MKYMIYTYSREKKTEYPEYATLTIPTYIVIFFFKRPRVVRSINFYACSLNNLPKYFLNITSNL